MNTKQVKALMKMPRTDEGNAQRLFFLFGRTWKYLPQYRSWMHWDGHCWEGRSTSDLCWAATDAFQKLAMEIYLLPVQQKDVPEQIYRLRILAWLFKSQITWHITLAVRLFKQMLEKEETAEQE